LKKKERERLARQKARTTKTAGRKSGGEIDLPGINLTPGNSFLLVALLLLVFILIQFLPVMTAPGSNIPYGDQDSENARVFNNFLRETFLSTGSFPLWNPYLFGGMPMIDSFTFPAYYPIYMVYLLAPGLMTLFHHITLHLLLAGIFTYLLARNLRLSRWSALAAASAYMLTGYTVSLTFAGHGGKIWTCAYIPLVLLGVDRVIRKPSAGSTAIAAAAFGLQLLAGHVQIVFYTWLTAGLFFLVRLRHWAAGAGAGDADSGPDRPDGKHSPVKTTALLGAALLIGLLAASAQYLPAAKYAAWSNRAAPDYEYLSKYSYPPEEILTLAFPRFFGYGDPDFDRTDPEMPDYWGRLPIRGSTEYVGAIVLLLAAAGIVLRLRGKEGAVLGGAAALGGTLFFLLNASGMVSFDRAWSSLFSGAVTGLAVASLYVAFAPLQRNLAAAGDGAGGETARSDPDGAVASPRWFDLDFRFFLLLGSLAAFLATGRYTPIYRFIAALPGFDKFRAPAQIVILISFAVSMAAGFGLESVLRADRTGLARRLRPVFATGAVLIVIGLIAWMAAGSISGLFEGKITGPDGRPLPGAILDIRVDRVVEDIVVFSLLWLAGALFLAGWSRRMFGTAILASALVVCLSVDLIRVNLRFIHPLEVEKEFTEFDNDPLFKFIASREGGYRVHNASLEKVAPNEGVYWKVPLTGGYHGAPMGDYWKMMTLNSDNFIYKFLMMTSARYLLLTQPVKSEVFREVYTGRTYVYDYLLALPRAYMVFGALTAEEHGEVPGLLESTLFDPSRNAVVEQETGFEPTPARGFIAAEIKEYENERVVIRAGAPERALLILTDTYYPGWKAEVDGEETEVLRVNFVQRGVLLEPGDHEVVFAFEPAANRAARLMCLTGLVAFTILAVGAVVSGRKDS